jgi:hypothetical protein
MGTELRGYDGYGDRLHVSLFKRICGFVLLSQQNKRISWIECRIWSIEHCIKGYNTMYPVRGSICQAAIRHSGCKRCSFPTTLGSRVL